MAITVGATGRFASAAIERGCGWLVGSSRGASYRLSRWVFLRLLGLTFMIAFGSLAIQVHGLIGSQGMLPAAELLQEVRGAGLGLDRFRLIPTLLWLGCSDGAITAVCLLGLACSVGLVLDRLPRLMLIAAWALYLSLVAVGQDFLSFQWDALLLETALLAVFAAPWRGARGRGAGPPALAWVLLWWLLFRLTFASGIVKLTWGDPTWRHLTALDYHFWTQPLPTWVAWYAAQLPAWVKRVATLGTLLLEVGAPVLIFGAHRLRWVGCAGIVGLQLVIGVTGNYTFFNLLTIALALTLLDDRVWRRVLPRPLQARFERREEAGTVARPLGFLPTLLGVVLLGAAGARFLETLTPAASPDGRLARALAWVDPLRSLNGYGLFRVMTTTRPEIVVEGSNDGVTWAPYAFRWKPGDVARRPGFVEPHQPRLDWQMWFAALSGYEATPWFPALLQRLLEGSPAVEGLLAADPFPDRPPTYVRALLYDYRFASPAERRATGAWWTRRLLGAYSPIRSLRR